MTDAFFYTMSRIVDDSSGYYWWRVATQPIGKFNGLNVYRGVFPPLKTIQNVSRFFDINDDEEEETTLFLQGSDCEYYDPENFSSPYHIPCSGSVEGENSVIHDKCSGWVSEDLYFYRKNGNREEDCYLQPTKVFKEGFTRSYDDVEVYYVSSYNDTGCYTIRTFIETDKWSGEVSSYYYVEYTWHVQTSRHSMTAYTRMFQSPTYKFRVAPMCVLGSLLSFKRGMPADERGLNAVSCNNPEWTDQGYFFHNLDVTETHRYFPEWKDQYVRTYSHSYDRKQPELDSNFVFRNRGSHVLSASLKSKCYVEAMEGLECNTNNIANLLSVVELICSLKSLDLKKIKNLPAEVISKAKHVGKTASETWLSYRYVYKTTLSDITEVGRFISSIKKRSQTLRGGQSTKDGTCRIMVKVKNSQLDPLFDSFDQLERYGVAPDFYNIWDLIPYSFIVDWFIDVGGFFEQLCNYGKTLKYDILSITTSFSWNDIILLDGIPVQMSHYERLVTTVAPPFIPYCETTSNKTWIMRIVDGVSLLFSR